MIKLETCLCFFLFMGMLVQHVIAQVDDTDLSEIEDDIETLQAELDELQEYVDTVKPTKNCDDLHEQDINDDGPYHVHIDGWFIHVYCQFEHNDTEDNWLVFQRRVNNSEDFYRNWKNYTDGFGNVSSNFWLGLENLHIILNTTTFTLRVDLVDDDGKETYAIYEDFMVSNSSDNYRLSVGAHSGTAVDALEYHDGMQFSTMDEDNDNWSDNCAKENKGAWWYNSCYRANLNGVYQENGARSFEGLVWFTVGGLPHSKKSVEMKIRPS